jgi:integrase
MSTIDAVINDARKLLHSTGWDQARLARAAQVSCRELTGIDESDWNPSVSVLRSIERLLVRQRKAALPHKVSEARRYFTPGFSPLRPDSFDWIADRYIRQIKSQGRKTVGREHNRLLRHVLPRWTGLKVADISERHVVELMDELQEELSQAYAADVFRTVNHVFREAVRCGLLANNPCQPFSLAPTTSGRRRVLQSEEIVMLWDRLEHGTRWPQVRLALLWQLVTAQRIGAVRLAHEREIDRAWSVWTIPGEHMKSGISHAVPLTSLAFDLLAGIDVHRQRCRLMFPSEQFRRQRPITHGVIRLALNEACRDIPEPITSHDLRRTAATTMVRLGVSRTVVQKVLGHSDRNAIAAYDGHDYEEEKRAALEAWATHLRELIPDDAVLRARSGWSVG